MESSSLYEQLGEEGLQLLVDKFYDLVMANPIISGLFTTDLDLVKKKQFMFLSQFLGGPSLYAQEYGHPRMRMRHMPHKITPLAAKNWLECMRIAIESLEIDHQLKVNIFQRFPNVAAHMVNTPDA